MCLLKTKELALMLSLSESFLWADYHLSLLCSHINQWSLLLYLISAIYQLTLIYLKTLLYHKYWKKVNTYIIF